MLHFTKKNFDPGELTETRPVRKILKNKLGLYLIFLDYKWSETGIISFIFNHRELHEYSFAPLDYFGTEEGRKAYLYYQLISFIYGESENILENTINNKLENIGEILYEMPEDEVDYNVLYDLFLKFILKDGFVNFGIGSPSNLGLISANFTGEIKKGEYFFITPFMGSNNLKSPRRSSECPIRDVIESGPEEFCFTDLSSFVSVKNPNMRLGAKEVVPYVEFPYLQGMACLQEVFRYGDLDKLDYPYVKEFMAIDTGEFADEWKFETVYNENWDYEKRKSAGLELSKSKDFEKILTEYKFNNRMSNRPKKPELRLKTIPEKWYYNPLKWEEENTD